MLLSRGSSHLAGTRPRCPFSVQAKQRRSWLPCGPHRLLLTSDIGSYAVVRRRRARSPFEGAVHAETARLGPSCGGQATGDAGASLVGNAIARGDAERTNGIVETAVDNGCVDGDVRERRRWRCIRREARLRDRATDSIGRWPHVRNCAPILDQRDKDRGSRSDEHGRITILGSTAPVHNDP